MTSAAPLSVACVLPDFDGGGAQRTLVNLAGAFQADGLRVRLIAGRADGAARQWLSPDVPLIDLGAPRMRGALPGLIRALRADPPDIVLSTMVDANILSWIAGRFVTPLPRLVLRETNSHRARNDIGWLRLALIGRAYRAADRVVALSEGVRQELVADYRLPPGRAVTIHNPVHLSPAGTTRPRPPGMPQGRCVVSAGRLTRQKNFPLLLDSFAALPGDTQLVILGDGPDKDTLRRQAEQLGVANRFHLPGFVDRPGDWFAHAAVFALSSRWEGFGHVIVEAMDAGAPVVATDCPHGPRDIIESGVNGLLVPNEDVKALTDALQRLLSDPEKAARPAIAGKQSAERFAVDRIAAEYRRLFDEILA